MENSYEACSKEMRALIRMLHIEHLAYFSTGDDPQSLKWAAITRKRLYSIRKAELSSTCEQDIVEGAP